MPPPGVEDYDLENWDDPNVCSEYAMDIFSYYKARLGSFVFIETTWVYISLENQNCSPDIENSSLA